MPAVRLFSAMQNQLKCSSLLATLFHLNIRLGDGRIAPCRSAHAAHLRLYSQRDKNPHEIGILFTTLSEYRVLPRAVRGTNLLACVSRHYSQQTIEQISRAQIIGFLRQFNASSQGSTGGETLGLSSTSVQLDEFAQGLHSSRAAQPSDPSRQLCCLVDAGTHALCWSHQSWQASVFRQSRRIARSR